MQNDIKKEKSHDCSVAINANPIKQRIGSIDALRAFALFGVLIVHILYGFGPTIDNLIQTDLDKVLNKVIVDFFFYRSALIFNILFGVSFYIILRRPTYPSIKFAWRCLILVFIGSINRFFYEGDALMLYGMFGWGLVLLRNVKTNTLLLMFFLLHILAFLLSYLNLGDIAFSNIPHIDRYSREHTFEDVIHFWPESFMLYFKSILNNGIFRTLANFIFGFWLGRIGFVEKMDSLIKLKHVCFFTVVYLILFVIYKLSNHYISNIEWWIYFINLTKNFGGISCYTCCLVYLYNHKKCLSGVFRHLENYGKLGLTNYSFQAIIFVLLLSNFGYSTTNPNLSKLLLIGVCLFLLQTVFSTIWLKYFKNGPMEYLWRCATEFKILPFLKR